MFICLSIHTTVPVYRLSDTESELCEWEHDKVTAAYTNMNRIIV
jgi:hypothetical protein